MVLNHELARDLLAIEAVQIRTEDYFTWTSGIRSPIYCDNRLTMSYPAVRNKITEAFVRHVGQMDEQPDVIAGCATAGIPHAAWIADALNLPLIYVRSKPKGHGRGNQIEGVLRSGQKVVVIEDLISTGGSAIASAQAVQTAGGNVSGVLAIFTYGLKEAERNFSAANLSREALITYDDMLEQLKINAAEKNQLKAWRSELC